MRLKNVGLTVSGRRYQMKLEDDFANYVNKNLREAGVNLATDNKPDKLLKAYLKLAKQVTSYENDIEFLIKTLDND